MGEREVGERERCQVSTRVGQDEGAMTHGRVGGWYVARRTRAHCPQAGVSCRQVSTRFTVPQEEGHFVGEVPDAVDHLPAGRLLRVRVHNNLEGRKRGQVGRWRGR